MTACIRFKFLAPAALAGLTALATLTPFAALANPRASRDALDALFSTQQARPEGLGDANPPQGFAGADASEADLIDYLARQRKLGADLNTYRHKGTPLHHAIRSGMHRTAAWLLKNGANPLLTIQEGAPSADDLDGLGVAIVVSDWKTAVMLLRLPAYQALPAAERAVRYWPVVMRVASQSDGRSERPSAELLAGGLPLPSFRHAPVIANALFAHSLCSGQTRFAAAQLDAEPLARPVPSRLPVAVCRPTGGTAQSGAPGRPLPINEWVALERRLQWPVLPYVVGQVRSPSQWRELLGSGLRLPWNDTVFTRQVVATALQEGARAVLTLRTVPAPALRAALQDEVLLRAWLGRSAEWPLPDLGFALDAVEPARLAQQLPHVVRAWDSALSTGRYAKNKEEQLARWALLMRHVRGPLPSSDDGLLLFRLPPALWPDWFAQGYQVSEAAWSSWLSAVDLTQLKELWPLLIQHQVAVTQRGLAWLIAPLSVGPVDDPQSRLHSYTGYVFPHPDQLAKVQFLHAQGLRVPQPRWLAAAYAEGESDELTQFAVDKGWVKRHPPILPKQVQLAPVLCRQVATAALRRALASHVMGQDPAQDFQIIQPMTRAGHADCAWLVSGGQPGGRRFIEDEDFFSGVQRLTPCADGNVTVAVWDEVRGRWLEVSGAPEGSLVAVVAPSSAQATSPRSTFVALEADSGTCGVRTGSVHEARFADHGALMLSTLGPGDAAFDALALQCKLENVSNCLIGDERQADPGDGGQVQGFADKFWGADKLAFLQALDRMDRAALSAAREAGLFGHWLDEAVRRVGTSPEWSVGDKRRRMAWLLAQRGLLPGLSLTTLEALLPWLPAQDWGPIIESVRCARPLVLKELDGMAGERKLGALGRRLQAALDLPCDAR